MWSELLLYWYENESLMVYGCSEYVGRQIRKVEIWRSNIDIRAYELNYVNLSSR